MERSFKNRNKWRNWLQKNHEKADEIWLVYYKKHTKIPSVVYHEAVEEAICFGWIDGKIQRIDDERYRQRFTPRRRGSLWSDLNRKRAERMISEGKMTGAGRAKIKEARENGHWQDPYSAKKEMDIPPDLLKALESNPVSYEFFKGLTRPYRNRYINWVGFAKRAGTRSNRIHKVVEMCGNKIKPGMQ
jgi:uncharacterized protein YdeI (YjbR/CyaY-like superfamily)